MPTGEPASGASSAQDPTGLKSRAASARTCRSAVATITASPVEAGSAMIRCRSVASASPTSRGTGAVFERDPVDPADVIGQHDRVPIQPGRRAARFPGGRDRTWAQTARRATGRERIDQIRPRIEPRDQDAAPPGDRVGRQRGGQADLVPAARPWPGPGPRGNSTAQQARSPRTACRRPRGAAAARPAARTRPACGSHLHDEATPRDLLRRDPDLAAVAADHRQGRRTGRRAPAASARARRRSSSRRSTPVSGSIPQSATPPVS